MATFTNQATLIFNGQSTVSNVTTGEIARGLTFTKLSISRDYGRDDHISYILTIQNTGGAMNDVTVTDDLGAYDVGDNTVTPFTYVEDSLLFFINGLPATGPVAVGGAQLVISGIDIPAGANVQIIYEVRTNEYTPHALGSSVTNTAALMNGCLADALTDTATVTAREEVSLSIAKAMTPTVVNEDGTLTYTFIIQNTGNTEVVATDDLIVTDSFNPILNPIAVTLNGEEWTEGTEYTYNEATGDFATLPGRITVPAATYTQDPITGVYSTIPGVTVLTVTGTV